MKRFFTLLLLSLALTTKAQLPSEELISFITFSGLQPAQKSGYGTIDDPIPSGAFKNMADRNKTREQMVRLKNSYRWPNGDIIDFSKRFSTRKKKGTGILDCYVLAQAGSTDTIKLFVDPYQDTTIYFVPQGLIAVTGTQLAKEMAPYVKVAEEINAAPDSYKLKETAAQLLTYISTHLGTTAFYDPDMLTTPMTDAQADKDLKGFLMRAYIFNKFIAYVKNLPAPKQYAYKQMKENFKKFQTLYPDVNSGNLAVTFQKD